MASLHTPIRVVPSDGRVEPLENGERPDAAEFLHRCEVPPRLQKAELIKSVGHRLMPVANDLCRRVTFPGVIFNVSALLVLDGVPAPADLNAAVKQQAHRRFVSRPVVPAGSTMENLAVQETRN